MIGLKTTYTFQQILDPSELKELLEEQKNNELITFNEDDIDAFIDYLEDYSHDMIYEAWLEAVTVAAERFCDNAMPLRMVDKEDAAREQAGWDRWKERRDDEEWK